MPEALDTATGFAATYLQLLQELAGEIQLAIDAIGANALSTLEESIARQEALCASLTSFSNQAAAHPVGTYLAEHIRSAAAAVRTLNLHYGTLLRHSSRSIALLAALCKSQAGELPTHPQDLPPTHQPNFSCEM